MREIFGCFLLQGHFLSPSPGAEEAEAVFQVIFWDTVITSFSKVYQESTQDASQTPRPISQGQRPKELTLSTNTFKQKHTFTQDKKKKKSEAEVLSFLGREHDWHSIRGWMSRQELMGFYQLYLQTALTNRFSCLGTAINGSHHQGNEGRTQTNISLSLLSLTPVSQSAFKLHDVYCMSVSVFSPCVVI